MASPPKIASGFARALSRASRGEKLILQLLASGFCMQNILAPVRAIHVRMYLDISPADIRIGYILKVIVRPQSSHIVLRVRVEHQNVPISAESGSYLSSIKFQIAILNSEGR